MNGIIDIHNHILPGVDDGPANLEETVQMLSQAVGEGITAVIATPHYHPGRGTTDISKTEQILSKVQEIAAGEGIPIKIYPGNEIFYHDAIIENLDSQKILTMNKTEYTLTEFYPEHPYNTIRQGLNCIVSGGYIPILAHAERYVEMLKNPDYIDDLIEMGCYIQLNASSIMGDHGRKIKSFCNRLLKNEMVHFVATDAHHASGSRTMQLQKCAIYIEKKYGRDYAEKLFVGNPSLLLKGVYI
ncbi:MAG: CpsB/CapC family capsule biosynthesis tyrosine phosphatase [Lachnospiraceae bacterium]